MFRLNRLACQGALAVVLAVVLIGCQGYSVTGGPGKTVNPKLMSSVASNRALVQVNSILVMPVIFSEQARRGASLEQHYEAELEKYLSQNVGVRVVRDSELKANQGRSSSTPALARQTSVSAAAARELARTQDLDSVLFTTVNQFQERSGSAAGSSESATVNFSMALLSVESGDQLWSANYNFKDEALTDNLFRIQDHVSDTQTGKRGLGWRSAHEVLLAAFNLASSDLAEKRETSFGAGNTGEVRK